MTTPLAQSPTPASDTPATADRPRSRSRRRRLWELGQHAHCPLVGVCLPISEVRKLVDKVLGGRTVATDYELHCGVNTECKQRGPVAERVQKALDQRHAELIRNGQAIKTEEALSTWWRERSASGEAVAGALWTTLTHACCGPALEEMVLQEVHMLQHQAGSAQRADLGRLQALQQENGVLGRALAAAQLRSTRSTQAHARQVEALQAALMQARAQLLAKDTLNASLRDEMQRLEASVPALRQRDELCRQLQWQTDRAQELDRSLRQTRQDLEREQRRADQAWACTVPTAVVSASEPESTAADLAQRAVLCVGGRQRNVPVYRRLIEQHGGQFLHHDGGQEDHAGRLDSTLAAADLVICQTGCISHGAYWRVKEHCKRTGKRCVFVENPSSSSLQRALAQCWAAAPSGALSETPTEVPAGLLADAPAPGSPS